MKFKFQSVIVSSRGFCRDSIRFRIALFLPQHVLHAPKQLWTEGGRSGVRDDADAHLSSRSLRKVRGILLLSHKKDIIPTKVYYFSRSAMLFAFSAMKVRSFPENELSL